MDSFEVEPKGDYVREVVGALRKMEGCNRQLQTENDQLTGQLRRLKQTLSTQASEIARLKLKEDQA